MVIKKIIIEIQEEKMNNKENYIDKETGEIHLGEIVIGPNTTWEDAEKLEPYASRVGKDDEICSMTMREKIVSAGMSASVKIVLFADMQDEGEMPRVEIMCEPLDEFDDPAKEWNYVWLDAGKVWLKELLGEPANETEQSINYEYDWGFVSIFVSKDIRGDLRGGEIEVEFKKE